MGDVTSTCCQNTTHMQEMNITRDLNSDNGHNEHSAQQYTYEPFQQPASKIKSTFKEAVQCHFFKYNSSSLSLEDDSDIWTEKNIIQIIKKPRGNTQSERSSIFEMISLFDSGKFSTYIKSILSDNIISQQPQNYKSQEHQAFINSDHKQKVFEGLFLIHFPGKQYFLGYLHNNQPTNGIFVFKPGCYYVGNIKNLTAQGQGKYQNKQNGYVYEGNWSKNLQHGKGKQFYQRNGDVFEGQFMYGSKFGEGKYTFSDGRIYEGYFYNGHSDGMGKLTVNAKQWYQGEWKLGSIQGKGEYHYANGDVYYGEFEDGMKSGKGRYVFSTGYEYDGEWFEGKMHGFGVIREGYDQIEGEWVQGKKVA